MPKPASTSKKNSKREKKKKEKKVPAKFDTSLGKERLIINLSYSHYSIVEEVAKNSFNYKISRLPDNRWDILWSDTVYSILL